MKRFSAAVLTNAFLVAILSIVGICCFYPMEVPTTTDEGNLYSCGDRESQEVSLMFNVYWGTDEVYEILDILEAYDAKATFFVGGSWADDNNACLKEILKHGHELGNHGYFHKEHSRLSYAENLAEIKNCHQLVQLISGYEMQLFAPPSGAYRKETLRAAEESGYKVILWSLDTVDWRDNQASVIYNRAVKAQGGEFVLMHPMSGTVQALADILGYYRTQNLTVVTVSENLSSKET